MNKIYDVIIVGSGPAGAWAAKQLKTKNILMLDVGNRPNFTYADNQDTFYDLKKDTKKGLPILIGQNFESLSNIFEDYLSPKLKAPFMKFVNRSTFNSVVDETGFNSQQSFATGGLANAWGAGCFRFQDYELKDFPFKSHDLNPYYDILTQKIGISGCDDDLTPFYGTTKDLLPAIDKTSQLEEIFRRYQIKKDYFKKQNIYFGHPRLAYKNFKPEGLEFYLPHNPSIYTPAFTIQELIDEKKITYTPEVCVEKFEEKNDSIEVNGRSTATNEQLKFKGKILVLAMGALNTAKCVLQSHEDFETQLPLLDNNISYVPFLFPKMLGGSWQTENIIGSPMTMVIQRENLLPMQVSIYNVGSVLISDLLPSLPISANYLAQTAKLALPSLVVAQVFYPDLPKNQNYLMLSPENRLRLNYSRDSQGTVESMLIKHLRKIGLYSSRFLIQYPMPGNSFHYAGMFPMKVIPKTRYECNQYGQLNGYQRVFINDASNFPSLPAKNHTFTIMANSMRIADRIQNKKLDAL